jgi:DNA-binding beta-propeller fold protein YncE
MKKITALTLWMAAAMAPAAWAQHAPTPREGLLVLSKGNRTLAIVDPATLKVVATMPSGEDPHEVTCDDHGNVAYITNYGTGRGGYNTLTVADLAGQKPLPTIDLGPLRGPHGIWFAAGKVYFTAEINKVIGRYDPAAGKVDWVMGTGQNITHMIKVTPDGSRIFTSNILSGSVTVLESITQEGMRATRFSPGANDWRATSLVVGEPNEEYEGFDVSPDWKELWTASPRGNVAVVDTASKKLLQVLDAKVIGANRVKFTPDGKFVLVSSLANQTGGNVVVFDAASRRELKRVAAGTGAGGIVMQPDGSRAYVACSRDGYVAVIDLKTLSTVGRIDAGPTPDGLAWMVRR